MWLSTRHLRHLSVSFRVIFRHSSPAAATAYRSLQIPHWSLLSPAELAHLPARSRMPRWEHSDPAASKSLCWLRMRLRASDWTPSLPVYRMFMRITFNAAVEACLLVAQLGEAGSAEAEVL